MIVNVKKNNGELVPFNPDKLNKWAEFAGTWNVDWSAVALQAYRKCYDECTTLELHKAMIDACVEKEDFPHLQMAGRLLIGTIYKEAFGGYRRIPTLKDFYEKMTHMKLWAKMDYSEEELIKLEEVINHDHDITYNYTTLRQMKDKYLLSNRVDKMCLESPQFMFMGMALQNMEKQPRDRRLDDVIKLYTYLKDLKINTPTPMLVNMRTNHKGYASCCVYTTEDNIGSLSAGDHIAYIMTCASAGIGGHLLTRSKGDSVKEGTVVHMGKLPYLRHIQTAVHANMQNCYSDDTEVLTSRGFVLFQDLTDEDLIAQVHNDNKVEFVKPIKRMEYDYKGNMKRFSSKGRRINMDLMVTPNHEMAFRKNVHSTSISHTNKLIEQGYTHVDKYNLSSPIIEKQEAKDFVPSRKTVIQRGGYLNNPNAREFSTLDALQMAYICDGLSKHTDNYGYSFRFSKLRKVERLKVILDKLGMKYSLKLQKTNVYSFYVNVGFKLHKELEDYLPDLSTIDNFWAEECLRELGHWDGSYVCDSSLDTMSFCTTNSKTANIVSSLAVLCQARVTETVSPQRNETWKDQYNLNITFNSNVFTGRGVESTDVEYDGKVYCVEVPTNNLIVRRDGMPIVCGNSRGGAATMYHNVMDPEIMDLLVLKNPTTVMQKRIRDIDYALNVNMFFVERVAKNLDWMLISYQTAPDLYDAFYSSDRKEFERLYEYYMNSDCKKEIVKAREIAVLALKEAAETGRIYICYIDEMNRHTPFKDKIYSSNLCLAGDQLVSTDKGLLTTKELYDMGEELLTHDGNRVNKTSAMKLREKNVPVYEITLSNGMKHKVTDYHKVLTSRGIVECKNLLVGQDQIAINKKEGLFGPRNDMKDEAFLLGLFEGDGTEHNDNVMIDIYGGKTLQLENLIQDKFNRVHYKYTNGTYNVFNGGDESVGEREYKPAQFFDQYCTIDKKRLSSRVLGSKHLNFKKGELPRWLRESDKETILEYVKGVFYTDGTFNISGSKGNPCYLSLTSTNKEYLEELQVLLNNLGYSFNLHIGRSEGNYLLPDGKGGMKEYFCKTTWRIVCSNKNDILKFESETGFLTMRGKKDQIENRNYRDNSKKFSTVVSVEYVGNEDVYCPTVESTEHLFVAQGVITHNCAEIALPTKPYSSMMDLYSEEPNGEIGLCSLASIVVGRVEGSEYEDVAYYTAMMIDNVIDLMEYPFPSLKATAQARRSIGVGMTNLAHELTQNHLSYASQAGKNYIHFLAEQHSYWLHKASLRLAKERGNASWIDKTKYPDGWLPVDTYCKEVDNITPNNLMFNWEKLREEIVEQGGIRHSVLEAMMPVESSSQLTNTTNGLYPIRSLKVMKTSNTNKNLLLAPDFDKLAPYYDIAWLLDSKDLIEAYAIVQKFTGQAISADLYLNLKDESTVSTSKLLKDFILMGKLGCKTRYYLNTAAGIIHESFVDQVEDTGCAGGACTL